MGPLVPVGILAISSDESICKPLLSYNERFLLFLQPLKILSFTQAGGREISG